MALANTLNATGRFPQAEDAYRRALDILERLGGGGSAPEAYRMRLALCLVNRANLHVNRHELEPAERSYRRSLAIYQPLHTAHPERAALSNELALAANNLGLLLAQNGRPGEAVPFGTLAETLWSRLAHDYPDVADYRRQQAHALNTLFLAHRAARRLDLASSCNERAIALRRNALAGRSRQLQAGDRPGGQLRQSRYLPA